MYEAKNVDTAKALKAIENKFSEISRQQNLDMRCIEKYYEGMRAGLNFAEHIFECENYEKDELLKGADSDGRD